MAPNKKKNKKPALNPARGFATTSTASKPRTGHDENPPVQDEANIASTPHNDVATSDPRTGASEASVQEADLFSLTPEQLESRLENEDLQLFVERHGAKAKKNSTRIISRLATERRLARAQADPLLLGRWLPDELMRVIAERLTEGYKREPAALSFTSMSDEELSAKLWALDQTLQGLGFTKGQTNEAFRSLVSTPALLERASNEEPHDGLWGLGICLEYFGVHCKEVDLPSYDSHSSAKKPTELIVQDSSSPSLSGKLSKIFWQSLGLILPGKRFTRQMAHGSLPKPSQAYKSGVQGALQ